MFPPMNGSPVLVIKQNLSLLLLHHGKNVVTRNHVSRLKSRVPLILEAKVRFTSVP
jgi:hypothetical protein